MAAAIPARARGAVLGSLVADAAAVPVHWCYDLAKLADHLKQAKSGPAFCDPPGNVFYTTARGGFSCYGEQSMALLESLVECHGKLDAEDFAKRLEARFGKASPYEVEAVDQENWPELKTNPTDAEGNVIEAERKWSMPLPGPWRHGSIKGFLKNFVNEKKLYPECGSTDEQVDGVCKVAPVVALFAGDPNMLPTVDTAVRVVQNTDKAAAFACGFARVLEKLVLGTASVQEAIALATKELMDPERAFKTTLDEEVAKTLERVVGELAGLSHSDAGMKLKPEAEPTYVEAVEASIACGGCTASRASIAGACFGSISSAEGIPVEWVATTTQGARVQELAEKLVAMRK